MRYLPLMARDRTEMLRTIGVEHIDELFGDVPVEARLEGLIDMPRAQGELEVERALTKMAAKNVTAGSVPFFVGAGAYRHHIPASVDHLIQRSEFLTSYTPYQPEISQGTLQYLFEKVRVLDVFIDIAANRVRGYFRKIETGTHSYPYFCLCYGGRVGFFRRRQKYGRCGVIR